MDKREKEFLKQLLDLSMPTGNEQPLQRFLKDWAEGFADRVEADLHGNLTVVVNPDKKLRVMLASHCDRIGFMVMDITEDGFLRIDPIGGIDKATVLGERVTVCTRNGKIDGVIGKTSLHIQKPEDQKRVLELDEVWIDIGAKDKKDAEKLVEIGDYVIYKYDIKHLANSFISAPGLDNMLGVYTVMKTAENCAKQGIDISLFCCSTVQEEIGTRGAKTAASPISPHVAIAVDTTLAYDTPGPAVKKTIPKIKLGQGPTVSFGPNSNPIVMRRLSAAAEKAKVPFQREPVAKTESNDAKPLQIADGGSAVGSIGIPLRYMHTQAEIACLDDVDYAVAALTRFIRDLKESTDFLPINADRYGEPAEGGTQEQPERPRLRA